MADECRCGVNLKTLECNQYTIHHIFSQWQFVLGCCIAWSTHGCTCFLCSSVCNQSVQEYSEAAKDNYLGGVTGKVGRPSNSCTTIHAGM